MLELNRNTIYRAFDSLRYRQAKDHGRPFTDMDNAVSEVVFNVSMAAINDVRENSSAVSMRAVALSTGTGKTVSSCAFIAAAALSVPKFTAAYIVPTIEMGIEVQQLIEKLLPGRTVLWTSAHKHKGRDTGAVRRRLGFVPDRVINKAVLPDSKVIIVTREMWQREIKAGADFGVRCYQGQRRDVVFVDEHPELVDIMNCQPSDVMRLHDDLAEVDGKHPWLPMLATVAGRMAELMGSHGQTYEAAGLLSADEGMVFRDAGAKDLLCLSDDDASEVTRSRESRERFKVVEFFNAAATGAAFYSRYDKRFFAYRLDFQPGPGHVLLDATSDITGLVSLRPDVEQVEVPEVDFSNLEIVHIKHPRAFKNVSRVVDYGEDALRYAKWMKASVLEHSKPGDKVLVVTHKAMIDRNYIRISKDPEKPTIWDGREVSVQTWGDGIGLNKFKDIGIVCSFGEFYRPRSATIGQTHGWGGKKLSNGGLKKAEGQATAGREFKPQGIYTATHDGDLLRWSKQLAMRGSARNIQADGKCGQMKWVTSMDRPRLLENLEVVFPGASLPVTARGLAKGKARSTTIHGQSGREGLVEILMAKEKGIIGADEIQRVTGIKSAKLAYHYNSKSVNPVAQAYGWRLVPAKEIGKAGRMRYLVNDQVIPKPATMA